MISCVVKTVALCLPAICQQKQLTKKYYENLSKYDVIDRLEQIPFVDQKRAATAVEMCAKHLSRRSTIVDLGCGVGILLNLFKKKWVEKFIWSGSSSECREVCEGSFWS